MNTNTKRAKGTYLTVYMDDGLMEKIRIVHEFYADTVEPCTRNFLVTSLLSHAVDQLNESLIDDLYPEDDVLVEELPSNAEKPDDMFQHTSSTLNQVPASSPLDFPISPDSVSVRTEGES